MRRYAYWATLEQRVRPMTWSRIRTTRENYKKYMETYKQIIANPNDTELKLDLQQHEDNLSIVNVVIARRHTRLLVSDHWKEKWRPAGPRHFYIYLLKNYFSVFFSPFPNIKLFYYINPDTFLIVLFEIFPN